MGSSKPWVLIPTAQAEHVPAQLTKWRGRGYDVAVWVDSTPLATLSMYVSLQLQGRYPGVWRAWNALARAVFASCPDTESVVLVGDDMDPDPNNDAARMADIYRECFPALDGVMQPCGDPQGTDRRGMRAAARICGSPWVGRRWALEAYDGLGPVNGAYRAFYADEELKLYAEQRSKLVMRPDLTQFHRHWSWGHLPRQPYHVRNQADWASDKALFESRKEANFP